MIHLGIERFELAVGLNTPPYLSKEFWEEFLYLEQQEKFRKAEASETRAFWQSAAQARSAGNLGDRPLIILTAGKVYDSPDPLLTKEIQDQLANLWIHVLQVEGARLSTRGRQIIVPDSGHVIPFERPDVAVSALHEVWSATTATR